MVPLLLLIAFLVLQKVIVVIMKRSTKSKSSFIKYTLILKAAKWSTGVSLKTESLIGLFPMDIHKFIRVLTPRPWPHVS